MCINSVNSNLPYIIKTFNYYATNFTPEGGKYYHDFPYTNPTGKIPFLFGSCAETTDAILISFSGATNNSFRVWIDRSVEGVVINILVLIPK